MREKLKNCNKKDAQIVPNNLQKISEIVLEEGIKELSGELSDGIECFRWTT
jgi:hypothetical protein